MRIGSVTHRVPDYALEIAKKRVQTAEMKTVKDTVRLRATDVTDGDHLSRLFGTNHTGRAGSASLLDGLRQASPGAGAGRDRARELIGDANGGFAGAPSGRVSEDPKADEGGSKVESPSLKDILVNFVMGLGTSKSPIPTPPVPPDAETGKSMWSGVTFFKDILGTGSYENHIDKRGGVDPKSEPVADPDTAAGPPKIITPEMLRGIRARKGALVDPNPDSQAGAGGPIDPTKTSGAADGPAGERATEVDRAVATSRDLQAIQIRLESKFKTRV